MAPRSPFSLLFYLFQTFDSASCRSRNAGRTDFPSLPEEVSSRAAAMGIVMSVGVGLFFGIWPANKAARLDPVVALRYE